MTTLVLGASGATGRQLVTQLLKKNQKVKVIVRSPKNFDTKRRNKVIIIKK